MRFSIDFLRAFFVFLRYFSPIWGTIAVLISLIGFIIAQQEALAVGDALYFAWVTGTTVGYGDIVPTMGFTRFLAIINALLGIVFTGIIVAMAIEAAKIAIENNSSIQAFKQAAAESTKKRIARDRKRQSKQGEEER